jgi:hypothetical protein
LKQAQLAVFIARRWRIRLREKEWDRWRSTI